MGITYGFLSRILLTFFLVFKYKEIDRAIENLNDRDSYLNELNNEIGNIH